MERTERVRAKELFALESRSGRGEAGGEWRGEGSRESAERAEDLGRRTGDQRGQGFVMLNRLYLLRVPLLSGDGTIVSGGGERGQNIGV